MADLNSVSEVARRLDVCSQTVRNMADSGKLPVLRTRGGQRLFRPEDVERVLAERQTANKDDEAA